MVLSDRRAKFQISAPVSALARRFLRFLLVKIFSDNFFHKIPKLYLGLSDRRAKFQVSTPVRALSSSFLRFYVGGALGGEKNFGTKIFRRSFRRCPYGHFLSTFFLGSFPL